MLIRTALLLPAVFAAASSPAGHTRVPAPQVVVIHAKDYAFSGPTSVKASGPITFRLVNDGKELHHLTIVKLSQGKTLNDLTAAMKNPGPPPSWTTYVGGPNPAVPGGSVEATLNLEPGNYAFLCFINSPGNPMPHMAKGMMGSITVEAGAAGVQQAGMLSSDVTIRLNDYKFDFSSPLTAGKHVINVVNDASQPHEVVLVKLAPGKKVADVADWVDKDLLKGPPPSAPVGGMAAIAKGRSATFPVNLTPGTYGILCFLPDAKDGKAHSMHGMQLQFEVK